MLMLMDPNVRPAPPSQSNQPFSAPPPAPQPNDPYHFILETQHKNKSSLRPSSNSLRSRLLVAVGGGAVLVFIIILATSIIGGGGKNNAQLLTGLVAEQQEIIRVSDIGIKSSADPDIQSFAETTKLSITTQQNKLITYLSSKNVALTPLMIAADADKTTDAAMDTAIKSNQFDAVFKDTLQKSLATYAVNLKKNYADASNPTSKTLLADSYNTIAVLLK
ncbi:hypothetical protein BH10PAT3_BH10PAT3_0340 [soil metagenome]